MATERRRRGRCELGLDKELSGRPDIGQAERAALRAGARLIDAAERAGEGDICDRANRTYLELRRAAGLTAGGGASAKPDRFDQWLRDLTTADHGNTENT